MLCHVSHYSQAARLTEATAAKDRLDRELQIMLADIYANLGRATLRLRRIHEARGWYSKSVRVWDELTNGRQSAAVPQSPSPGPGSLTAANAMKADEVRRKLEEINK